MMDDRPGAPTPAQALLLWALLGAGGAALQKDVTPKVDKADREALIRHGLLKSVKAGRTSRLEVTDRGWSWAGENTAAALPAKSTAGTAVLHALLARLGGYMAARNVALADIIAPQPEQDRAPPPAHDPAGGTGAPHDLLGRIREAYLAETGGALNRRVRLAALRARLADMPRAQLDAALLALGQQGVGSLYPLDDPTEIATADRDAAIRVGTEMRHLLWMHR